MITDRDNLSKNSFLQKYKIQKEPSGDGRALLRSLILPYHEKITSLLRF